MPTFDEAILVSDIAHGRIGGISLDTTAFDRYQCNLQAPALLGLAQFLGSKTQFILSDVVAGEIKSHVARDAANAKQELLSALREVRHRWRRPVDSKAIEVALGLEQPTQDFAEDYFDVFAGVTKPDLISADGRVTHAEILRRYFAPEPPFSTKDRKKSEFPDALALLSLESWAADNKTLVLVVSRDGDWQTFAGARQAGSDPLPRRRFPARLKEKI
ncbi:PIN domain-containing protein [Mesorhizobium sp. M0435]|uniref:PIN domain-containing protein n=1 Tax=Mesorhizobium sp. M0435 TaxID=2956944 RepID=UPI00333DBF1B